MLNSLSKVKENQTDKQELENIIQFCERDEDKFYSRFLESWENHFQEGEYFKRQQHAAVQRMSHIYNSQEQNVKIPDLI